jgi:hypothetical protein
MSQKPEQQSWFRRHACPTGLQRAAATAAPAPPTSATAPPAMPAASRVMNPRREVLAVATALASSSKRWDSDGSLMGLSSH